MSKSTAHLQLTETTVSTWLITIIHFVVCVNQFVHSDSLTSPAKSIEKKMSQLCSFMDESLGLMMYPELILAKRYFKKGHTLGFFGKMQKGRADILALIKNMTWDLFHLRMQEVSCIALTSPNADLYVPYLFTFDKRLKEIKDCYELEALAVNTAAYERFPFYAHQNEILPFIESVATLEKATQRRDRNLTMDFPVFIKECEKNFIAAMAK